MGAYVYCCGELIKTNKQTQTKPTNQQQNTPNTIKIALFKQIVTEVQVIL